MKSMLQRIAYWIKFPYLWARYGSPIKSDETVVLFPQSASLRHPKGADSHWEIPVHAWVVEKESGTLSRLIGRYSVLSVLGLAGVVDRRSATAVFENRLSWFMADREVNKKVSISVGGETFLSPRTKPNGHVLFSVPYRGVAPAGSVLTYKVVDLPPGQHCIEGRVQLIAEQGVSVISDFDDTIKISNVTSKKELLRGLFFDDYHPAPGMPEFYLQLANAGVSFHYVSASPIQLYPSIAPFLDKYYPFGCLTQRHFYVADKSFINFFRSSMQYKIETVSQLIERYPQRRFILIGDSGEKDPEVYCQIAKQYPDQVSDILIREVFTGSELKDANHNARWQQIKSQLADHQNFTAFHDPTELGAIASWINHSHNGTAAV